MVGADLIFRNEWKIWHLHYFRFIRCDYEKGWVKDTSMINRLNTPMHPLSKPTTYHNPYSPLSIREVKNLRGQAAIFHDDQHIGEKHRELKALKHPSFNVEAEMKFRNTPVVDSLEGNMLHPLTTPVIEVNEENNVCRSTWWSLGIEGLSKFREKPMAILSVGMVPGVQVKEDDEWKILSGAWQRTTKNEYKAGWVSSMVSTNTRPQISMEEDRNRLGKYAYRKNEVRKPVPCPPRKDSFFEDQDETSMDWLYRNL